MGSNALPLVQCGRSNHVPNWCRFNGLPSGSLRSLRYDFHNTQFTECKNPIQCKPDLLNNRVCGALLHAESCVGGQTSFLWFSAEVPSSTKILNNILNIVEYCAISYNIEQYCTISWSKLCYLGFGEGVPAQASSSSSDGGSKLRGPSQNSPRVSLERDVNITKLNCVIGIVTAMQ
ncbi:hypothetical protein AVEN_233681-1 [Araneus ventricosus]|uniref:Uncharacterized protein n=1 Tax=Araneus ventricosus TaxID=182803 RepID=A0A4Y2MAY8_ARAVE|nr:hypothetical protein AVEN_233681-1 [Araneus ventricosus]